MDETLIEETAKLTIVGEELAIRMNLMKNKDRQNSVKQQIQNLQERIRKC